MQKPYGAVPYKSNLGNAPSDGEAKEAREDLRHAAAFALAEDSLPGDGLELLQDYVATMYNPAKVARYLKA